MSPVFVSRSELTAVIGRGHSFHSHKTPEGQSPELLHEEIRESLKVFVGLLVVSKIRPAKARLSVGFKFNGAVDYHSAS